MNPRTTVFSNMDNSKKSKGRSGEQDNMPTLKNNNARRGMKPKTASPTSPSHFLVYLLSSQ
jgi:hypothetical protein